MAQQKPRVLMLAKEWLQDNDPHDETLLLSKTLARDLAAKGAEVYCTTPHFGHELQGDHALQLERCNDAARHGVRLVGAAHRPGRREVPDSTWITDYWRQYYHDGIRPDGYNGPFTHIVGFVPETYHSALDIAEEYKNDYSQSVKVVLIITDIDHQGYSTSDDDINRAHQVYVLGPRLFSEYHQFQDKFTKVMPLTLFRGSTASDATPSADPFSQREYDVKIVSVWPSYIHTTAQEETEGLATVAKVIDRLAKQRQRDLGQKVRWEIRGLPHTLTATVKAVVCPSECTISFNPSREAFAASNYTLYVSPLRRNPCDLYCLQAMQQGLPALLYAESGLGQYLRLRDIELGNQLVASVLVNCEEQDHLENWALAFDNLFKHGKENAEKLASRLQRWQDKPWSDLVSAIVPDAVVDYSGVGHVPHGDIKVEVYPTSQSASARGVSRDPHPINPEVARDQEKALAQDADKRRVAAEKAPCPESTTLRCTRPWRDVFGDADLAMLSGRLTAELTNLAKLLGKQQHDVDRYRCDNPHNSAAAVSAMLTDVRNSSPLHGRPEQVQQLVDALVKVGRMDLALEVAGPQPAGSFYASTPSSGSLSRDEPVRDTTDLTRRRVKLWQNEERFYKLRSDDKNVYKMEGRPRGFAILVNMETIDGQSQRLGSEKDVLMIENVFSQLHFEIKKLQNCTLANLLFELKKVAENSTELRSHDCLALFLMSHGQKDKLFCSDGKSVELKDLYQIFEKCPALRGKPKLYVIQACRTEESAGGQGYTEADSGTGHYRDFTLPGDGSSHQDTLLAYSTVDGTKSFRNTVAGSWYIEALAENLCEHACHEHLFDILTRVNNEIKERSQKPEFDRQQNCWVTRNQCAELQSRLTKQFYLFPGK